MAKRQKKSLLSTVTDDKIESKEEILKELKEEKNFKALFFIDG